MVTYTPILKLTQPDFDQTPWDEQINNDLSILDAAFGKFFSAPGLSGVWQNATTYVVGQSVVEPIDSTIWTCQVSNTSAAAPTTFAQDRTAHPTYWTSTGTVSGYLPITGGILEGNLGIDGAAGTSRGVSGYTGGSLRWSIVLGNTELETGGNAGSKFAIARANDAGVTIDAPLSIDRATGFVSVSDIATNNALRFTNTGGFIAGDAVTVSWALDGNLWRWSYIRSGTFGGVIQYVRGGDGQVLFQIDNAGNVYCHGTFLPGSVMSTTGEVLSSHDRIAELEARIAALEAKV